MFIIQLLIICTFIVAVAIVALNFLMGEDAPLPEVNGSAKKVALASGLAVLLLIFNPFVKVEEGTLGIVKTFGKISPEPLSPGLHLVLPVVQEVDPWNVRVMKQVSQATAGSKDMQTVNTAVALNFRINPKTIVNTYSTVGSQIGATIIDPAVLEVVKAVTAKYTATELITKRDEVSAQIREGVTRRITPYGLIVDEFSITNFTFSSSFSASIEAKQVAEQQALKAARDLERVKIEAEQKVAQARAEAESLRLQKQEITPELLRLREIEMQSKAIEKWNGVLPTTTGGALPLINLPSSK